MGVGAMQGDGSKAMTRGRIAAWAPGFLALCLLAACNGGSDWDLRTNDSSTSSVAQSVVDDRPAPDANGVISYSGYQVVVARQGDTVTDVANRLGIDANQLASYNALQSGDALRAGEVLALPKGVSVASTAPVVTGNVIGTSTPSGVDVSAIATTALDEIDAGAAAPQSGTSVPFQAATPGPEPLRHQVLRGETAFTIARLYNVSAKDLADWNGLGPDFAVREGQYLLIPTTTNGAAPAPATPTETAPGEGSQTPAPPSASEPLPDEATQPAAETAKATPASPELGAQRTSASSATFAMPLDGSIIRAYQKGKNDGVDIAAAAGSTVKAAADGTVAAITQDTEGTPILVIRHANNLLTVYAGVDGIKVAKGDTVKRGQAIAVVKAGNPSFLHFEVRQGIDSVDPMPYLQ
jgi:murein DD-endopeptidase MepM/ murein hydrolase activator NlpD